MTTEATTTAIKEFELINVNINDIELDPSNPNVMTKEQMSAMRKSMQQYGYLVPVILDRNNKICDGEHRVLVYKELGLSTIPAYRVDLDSDTDRKQLRQIMNKLHGQHDRSKDADEFLEILQNSRDGTLKQLSELIAQPQEQLLSLIKYFHPEVDLGLQDKQQQQAGDLLANITQRTQLGDLWDLDNGKHRVYCGDNIEVLKTQLPDNCIDLTVTSPPYDALRQYQGYTFDFEGLAEQLYRVTKPGGIVVWVVGDATVNGSETLSSFKQAIHFNKIGFLVYDTMIYLKSGFRRPEAVRYHQVFEYMFVLCKDKSPPTIFNPISDRMNKNVGETSVSVQRGEDGTRRLTGGDPTRTIGEFGWRTNVWLYDTGYSMSATDKEAFEHPAIFPEQLAIDHIKSWSNPGSLVLDPFLGSGTTLMAAAKEGRRSIGIDIAPKYVDIALQRFQNLTNEAPVKQEQQE